MKTDFNIPVELSQLITSEQAYHYRIVPDVSSNGILKLRSDKVSETLLQELQIIFDSEIELIEETQENLQQYLSINYRKHNQSQSKDLHHSQDFLQKLVLTAKDIGSSDIHFEPYEHKCRVRFRIDGKLKEYYVIAIREYPEIINKLKIQAGLDISEKRLPQDGRITIKTNHDEFDIRVSTLPTLHGEKIVLRILSKDTDQINLKDLGFTDHELYTYKESIRKPNGIILISGPTGSGKTTTLYATLKVLNDDKTNVLTIEDPIEYTLEGINQVQLKENIGLDFASTLRTFLRQDPDVIMVGEIRDVATANMAIRAALTGHLVLSTIHTNSAWATVSRLIDMGVPPFLIASTLNVSIAQRLVRKLCDSCKEKSTVSQSLFPSGFQIPKSLKTHYKPIGCEHCYYTGYKGRQAIYEILPIGRELSKSIKDNVLQIDQYLEDNSINTLKKNALQLISDGVTSIDEVYALLSN